MLYSGGRNVSESYERELLRRIQRWSATIILAAILVISAGFLFWLALAEDSEPRVYLFRTIVTPTGRPDVYLRVPMQSADECWRRAREIFDQGVPASILDGKFIIAGCGRPADTGS